MKLVFTAATALTLVSQIAFAGNITCGASVEAVKGSNNYNKNVFTESAQIGKKVVRYLLEDGTVVRAEDLKDANSLEQIKDGSLVMSYNLENDRIQLYTGIVKRNQIGEFKYENLALSLGQYGSPNVLISNNASVYCASK
jgi:hypothetical protein